MKIGIVGLGLIGGSLARAYRVFALENSKEIQIFAADKMGTILDFAIMSGVVDAPLDESTIPECDAIFIGLYPEATVEYIEKNASLFAKNTIVMDLCGTKAKVCSRGFELARQHGFTFVGGHPMAGTQFSGYKNSRADMFKGAPMVIVPPTFNDIDLISRVKELLLPAGFGRFSYVDAERHDKLIAFTSQLAHVVSNAYVKSPTAREHKGFSAGSYRDMTRVAWLNEQMWTELFFENSEPLIFEIDTIINSLTEYKIALESGDREKMTALLREGRIAKEEIDA